MLGSAVLFPFIFYFQGFMLLATVTLLGMILISMNDQQRYRFRTDALSLVLLIVAIRFAYRLIRRWCRRLVRHRMLNARYGGCL